MKNNIIKTITIDIAGTEVVVTPEQAKNLHLALAELLGLDKEPVQKVVERHYDRSPYYPPYRWTTGIATFPNDWKISYTNGTGNVNLSV